MAAASIHTGSGDLGTQSTTPMICLYGRAVASGYAIGRAVLMGAAALEVAHYRVASDAIDVEKNRLILALNQAREDLVSLIDDLPADAPRELAALMQVHMLLLDDPLLSDEALSLIEERQYNAEWALTTQGQLLVEQFNAMEDEYLRERSADVRQVVERILHALSGSSAKSRLDDVCQSDEPLIVVARDITPADMIRLRDAQFAGYVTELGGPTSHTAIVARSMGVPAVVAMSNARTVIRDGDYLILDGQQGAVIVNPPPLQKAHYETLAKRYQEKREKLLQLRDVPAHTLDGINIQLMANIELPDEVTLALSQGAQGIGLFRTEFLFMGRRDLPGEEEQFQAYQSVVRRMQGLPVTIRTLDVGADKSLDGEATVATNPAMGLRAIRYCLANPELFATQLRAILRASAFGHVRILIPMITNMAEAQATCQMINTVRDELKARGVAVGDNIEFGAMVEVPAMAIAIEPFAEFFDFLSIGTNDLIQYTLGVDRGDSDVSDLYDPLHPAVLRLLATVINAGQRLNKPVSVCGEMAGHSELTRLLLGLGLTQFSMHPRQLLDVKQEILKAHTNALRARLAVVLNQAQSIDPDYLLGL